MKNILFLGSCQINAMRGISRGMFSKVPCQHRTITPYWGNFDEVEIRERLSEADLVISQAIENQNTAFNVDDVRASTNGDVVFVPYVYVDGIAGLEIIASKGRSVLKGHESVDRVWNGQRPFEVIKDYMDGKIDLKNKERVSTSIARLAEKEVSCCHIRISDYIEDTWRIQPTLWAINHPAQHVLFEMFRRLCDHIGWQYRHDFSQDPVEWGKRALPLSMRSFTPFDVEALGLKYDPDPHWYGQAKKLITLAVKRSEQAAAEAMDNET